MLNLTVVALVLTCVHGAQAAIQFIYLTQRRWVEAKSYPRLTLLGQSLGSMILAAEAVIRLPVPVRRMPPLPHPLTLGSAECACRGQVFVDTTGYAFSFPVARYLGGCSVGCYVHYPTISTDMLAAVASRNVCGSVGSCRLAVPSY
eukprot:COSAG01_NODE_27698_length_679_cov_0.910345_1_plen_145_part_10